MEISIFLAVKCKVSTQTCTDIGIVAAAVAVVTTQNGYYLTNFGRSVLCLAKFQPFWIDAILLMYTTYTKYTCWIYWFKPIHSLCVFEYYISGFVSMPFVPNATRISCIQQHKWIYFNQSLCNCIASANVAIHGYRNYLDTPDTPHNKADLRSTNHKTRPFLAKKIKLVYINRLMDGNSIRWSPKIAPMRKKEMEILCENIDFNLWRLVHMCHKRKIHSYLFRFTSSYPRATIQQYYFSSR